MIFREIYSENLVFFIILYTWWYKGLILKGIINLYSMNETIDKISNK